MDDLIKLAKKTLDEQKTFPFSIYSSTKEQNITNVPVIKPLLIFILNGSKQLGKDKIDCLSGTFVFLSNTPDIDMRNIPDNEPYFAILIEFEYADFAQFKRQKNHKTPYFQGKIDSLIESALAQFLEMSMLVPAETLQLRKQEMLQLLYLSGYHDVANIAKPPNVSQQVHDMINEDIAHDWLIEHLAERLFMSESTLRRKLKAEGTNIKKIRLIARLGHGLHLIQTTQQSIGNIAMHCGFQSQSRFSAHFKRQFGITPSALRRTRE